MQVRRLVLTCAVLILVSAPRIHGQEQEPLVAARQLYASAEYEDALRLLDGLTIGSASPEERQAVELYRALCLLAVGRRADAERSIEGMIAQDPLYRPADDISPRMRVAFSDARKRMLPTIVQQDYSEGKSAFDRQDFVAAASAFKRVVEVLSDPDITQAAAQPPLSDLRTLASGFHDLSVKAIPPALPPPPIDDQPSEGNTAAKIYTGEEPGVVPPVALRQDMPQYPGAVRAGGLKGVMEIVIDERGAFESGRMRVPIDSKYDNLLLTAATRWVYTPATMNGTAVKFFRSIHITIAESSVR